jgi:hypothetical protein
VIGGSVNFRVALCVSVASSWLFLLFFFLRFRNATPPWRPKLLEVANPISFSLMLIPAFQKGGEDFARLWVGVFICALLSAVCLGSLVIGRPFVSDFIPPPEDSRLHKPVAAMVHSLTVTLGVIFVFMLGCNLLVATEGYKFGTDYVLWNFAIPFGSLVLGLLCVMPRVAKASFTKVALEEHGPDWERALFPEQVAAREGGAVAASTEEYIGADGIARRHESGGPVAL